jgi:hypothetical protein
MFHAYDVVRTAYVAQRQQTLEMLTRELEEGIGAQRKFVESELSTSLEQANKSCGPDGERMRIATELSSKAASDARRLEAELARPLRTSMIWSYPFIMLAVAIVEVPVNRMAFELFFQETPALSLLIALTIGGMLALFAHFIGLWIKQANQYRHIRKRVGHYVGAVFLITLTLPLIYLIAALRQHYIALLEADQASSFGALLQQGGAGSFTGTAAKIVGVEMGAGGWTLFVVNIVIITVGILVSFVRHDPHPDYEKVTKFARRHNKALQKLTLKFEKKIKEITEDFDERLSTINRQEKTLEAEIVSIGAEINAAERHLKENIKAVTLNVCSRIASYQRGNRSARTDGVPLCFQRIDEQEIERNLLEGFNNENSDNNPDVVHGHIYVDIRNS